MPVIVLATSGRNVLISIPGKWLADDTPGLHEAQRIYLPEARRAAADREATSRARHLGEDVKYTPLVWKPKDSHGDDRFSTRYSRPGESPGFVKGTFPDRAFPGESEADAARREFQEETGTAIDPAWTWTRVAPNVFRVEVPESKTKGILRSWKAMGREGELHDLRWEPISDVRKDIRLLNTESRSAVQYLPLKAGTRRRRNGKRTLRR